MKDASELLTKARDRILMFADVVEQQNGFPDDYSRELAAEIDAWLAQETPDG